MNESLWDTRPERYVAVKDESRKTILYPWLRDKIHQLSPNKIIDFGAGDGSLFHEFDSEYEELTLYDTSVRMLEIARGNFCGNNRVFFVSKSEELEKDSYNLVVCSLVLMTIPTLYELRNACSVMHHSAIKGAHCLVAITHPCFRQYPFSTFATDLTGESFLYMKDGMPFHVLLRDYQENEVTLFDYHWSLSTTINILIDVGFSLRQMIELPDKAVIGQPENKLFPPYIILDFIKE